MLQMCYRCLPTNATCYWTLFSFSAEVQRNNVHLVVSKIFTSQNVLHILSASFSVNGFETCLLNTSGSRLHNLLHSDRGTTATRNDETFIASSCEATLMFEARSTAEIFISGRRKLLLPSIPSMQIFNYVPIPLNNFRLRKPTVSQL